MKLKKVTIHKYKSFETDQSFEVESDVTALVGMNESGKTSALEVIAKTNYFQDDEDFIFNLTHDYPRREKKKIEKSGEDPRAVTCTYEISKDLIKKIEDEIGKDVLKSNEFSITYKYSNSARNFGHIHADKKKFIEYKTKELGIASKSTTEKLMKVSSVAGFEEVASSFKDDSYVESFKELKKFFEFKWRFDNPIEEYIARNHLDTNIPKFLYYDEYYSLPSRISIQKLEQSKLEDSEYKTAKALFELSDINTNELIESEDFEDFVAELEATEAIISDELFKYWTTNSNLNISFRIDKRIETDEQNNKRIAEHILDIRVKGKNVSLPLRNRSKGFNWFFSFLVWFKKIQEDTNNQYVLLLDEPGLNLHASAQADLLRFLEDLSENYQIIYSTHSPFMIQPGQLNRVRTVLETDNGSVISDSIQEKDPKTLFPLQAALGYDIAQNLFISSKNLLVEGVSDLIFLTTISGILEANKRQFLNPDITIVPTGGLEKVATFISLLRGSQLEIACLIDSYTDPVGQAKMDKMIREKIIHRNKIRFFDEFVDGQDKADLEDLFEKSDYLKLFNAAFTEYADIQESDLNASIKTIIIQINQHLSISRFNHYRPANELVKQAIDESFFAAETLNRFENVFKEINKLFE
ncbi:AAA family ATPase [Owenweeksia hongkongensis]|uniref:AAA family ATPase n=1 Tax=Owenweeksia hongkongensis TaxID=253245 RepID=UPI003A952D6D